MRIPEFFTKGKKLVSRLTTYPTQSVRYEKRTDIFHDAVLRRMEEGTVHQWSSIFWKEFGKNHDFETAFTLAETTIDEIYDSDSLTK